MIWPVPGKTKLSAASTDGGISTTRLLRIIAETSQNDVPAASHATVNVVDRRWAVQASHLGQFHPFNICLGEGFDDTCLGTNDGLVCLIINGCQLGCLGLCHESRDRHTCLGLRDDCIMGGFVLLEKILGVGARASLDLGEDIVNVGEQYRHGFVERRELLF